MQILAPVLRSQSAVICSYGTETEDTFAYNTRSELTSARVNSADYAYSYDAVDNRAAATEAGTRTEYSTHNLNRYTKVADFKPTYDFDGKLAVHNRVSIRLRARTGSVTMPA